MAAGGSMEAKAATLFGNLDQVQLQHKNNMLVSGGGNSGKHLRGKGIILISF